MTVATSLDDPYLLADQGTVGLELHVCQDQKIATIFCSTRNEDLLAGVALVIKGITPEVLVIGVETDDEMGDPLSWNRSLISARREEAGIETEAAQVCRQYVDEILPVDADEVVAAMQDTSSVVQPRSAIAIAGLKKFCKAKHRPLDPSASLCAILSDGSSGLDNIRAMLPRS